MKSFYEYLTEREQPAPSDGMGLGNLTTPSTDDATLMHLAKIAVDDHRTDALNFFQHLAKKDKRIEQELNDYHHARKHGSRPKTNKLPGHDDRDEVVPSSADGQGGLEGGGEE